MTNAARRELVQKCRCIPNPTWGRKPKLLVKHPSQFGVHPQPHLGTETPTLRRTRYLQMGASPTPPGDGNELKSAAPAPAGWVHPQPHLGTETTSVPMILTADAVHPQPHLGTEPQTRHRRYRPRLCLLYDWDMSWNTLRNQHIKGKTAGIST